MFKKSKRAAVMILIMMYNLNCLLDQAAPLHCLKPPVSCTDMDCDYSRASSDHKEISDDYVDYLSDATAEFKSNFCRTGCAHVCVSKRLMYRV